LEEPEGIIFNIESFYLEDGASSRFLQNVDTYPPNYMLSHLRKKIPTAIRI
jgi:hypothetical protein